jgi:hypothetical protein
MASHWSFGHLQPKLWVKERPGVKLAVWLPTTKSRELTRSRRALREWDTALESPRRRLQVWFRPCPDRRLGQEATMSQSLENPNPGQFRDSTLGVSGKSVIRVQVRRRGTKNITGRMVVAPLESGPWWVLCVKVPEACPNTQGCSRMWTNPLWLVLDADSSLII